MLDLANNHQGDVDHGKRVIREHGAAVAEAGVRAAMKFQFRDLPDFVHPDDRKSSTNKHVPRFLSTRLPWKAYEEMLAEARAQGMLGMCTPFDEASVDQIERMDFDIIKVASCSAADWPLLERVAASGLPVIASTGGLTIHEVDALNSFLQHRACDYALMHCVSIYPTPDDACNLGNIAEFKERYRGVVIGWSTHENPADTVHVGLAQALGAEMFERHVGVPTDEITLNAYSATPDQDPRLAGRLDAGAQDHRSPGARRTTSRGGGGHRRSRAGHLRAEGHREGGRRSGPKTSISPSRVARGRSRPARGPTA